MALWAQRLPVACIHPGWGVLTGREAVVGTMPDTLQLANDGATLVVTLRGNPAQISLLDLETFIATVVTIPERKSMRRIRRSRPAT